MEFVNSRIGTFATEVIENKQSVDLKLSTFPQLFSSVDFYDRSVENSTLKTYPSSLNLSEDHGIDFLNNLMDGIPIQLELNNTDTSSVFFDVRDLKNSLTAEVDWAPAGSGEMKSSGELLIPQIIPINIDGFNIEKNEYDSFIAVKVELLDAAGNLGVTEFVDLPSQDNEELGASLIGVTRTVEIDADVDTRSKLLIGLSVPKDTDLKKLPDFVRFNISLSDISQKLPTQEIKLAPRVLEAGSLIGESEVKGATDFSATARELILALKEMSGVSHNNVQIVTKATPNDVMIKIMPEFDLPQSWAPEKNTLSSALNNDDMNVFEQKPIPINLIQNRLLFDKELSFFSSARNDRRAEFISSSLALDSQLKQFNKEKSGKNNFLIEGDSLNAPGQKKSVSVFNPKSFLEASETLRMKPISFPSGLSQGEPWKGSQSDITNFIPTKNDSQVTTSSGIVSNSDGTASVLNNKISLYSSQYASRISMMVVDRVLKGQENFEIHLEPESFGKIKVNVLLDKQALDIRMFVETQAAASLLKANEESLLQITGQNGMKLANFAVGMQSGNDQQRQNSNQNQNRVTDKANSVRARAAIQNSQTPISYRTPTGLNLIA